MTDNVANAEQALRRTAALAEAVLERARARVRAGEPPIAAAFAEIVSAPPIELGALTLALLVVLLERDAKESPRAIH